MRHSVAASPRPENFPATQFEQSVTESPEAPLNFPAVHGSHKLPDSKYEPAGQVSVHAVAPAGDTIEGEEPVQFLQEVSCNPLNVPAPHNVQAVAATADQLPYVHGLHTSLVLAPITVENLPAAQSTHTEAASALYLPASQVTQLVGAV